MAITTQTRALLADIAQGVYDADLAAINDMVRQRTKDIRTANARLAVATTEPGDTVEITGGLRPAYLVGLTAEVIETNRTRLVVRMENTAKARRFAGAQVTVPANCTKVVVNA